MSAITRRQMLAATAALPFAAPAQNTGKRNVLFIAVDDLNNWIGCLGGHPQTKTPNLDRLAARGVLFTKAYCAAPLCNPSRAALMTGLRPSSTGIYDNSQPFRQGPSKNALTVAQYFRANGYKAMGSGKIFHDAFPDPASWDEWFPKPEQQKPADPRPANTPLNGIPNTAQFDWGPIKNPDSDMGDFKVANYVTSQLLKKHDKPFFLACGIFKPHLPWYVPEKYFDMHPLETIKLPSVKDDDLDDVPAIGKKMAKANGDHKSVVQYKQWHRAVQSYLAAITFADAQIGRVIDALDASPYRENTTIVLWSDHGWHLGQKLHWRKFALWEEATHNVFMMVAPGLTKPGGRCTHPVSLMDIYPTLVELHGLPAKPGLEGNSLMPLLKNPVANWDKPAVTTYGRNNHSVRSDRFRYIRYSDGGEELYDHHDDDLEWHNLASDPRYAVVKRDLARWLPQTNAPDSIRTRGGAE
ncbi:MAG: sulfatase [Candidatus Solibacter usitatus]|nr:sulfatase [Candidatus Solibacter usitatus]